MQRQSTLRNHTILVCGGRKYGVLPAHWEDDTQAVKEQILLTKYLDAIAAKCNIIRLVHGAAKGADSLAGAWSRDKGIDTKAYPAEWRKYDKAAGSIRNQQMLDEEEITLVIAFPGTSGTADMKRRARAAGIPVLEVKL